MAIDASIALNANRPVPTQYNPLQMQAQVAQTGSAIIGAQRAQAEYAAQQAQGRASQGAIGPGGVYDPAAANSAMSADPAAAYGIQGALSNNQKLAQDQQTRSTQAQSNISQMYTSLLSLPDSQLTAQAITGGLSRYRASGAINLVFHALGNAAQNTVGMVTAFQMAPEALILRPLLFTEYLNLNQIGDHKDQVITDQWLKSTRVGESHQEFDSLNCTKQAVYELVW